MLSPIGALEPDEVLHVYVHADNPLAYPGGLEIYGYVSVEQKFTLEGVYAEDVTVVL